MNLDRKNLVNASGKLDIFLQSKHITSKDVSLINTVRNIIFYLSVKNFFTEESFADWEISSVELLCKNLSVTWMNEKANGNSQNN